MSRGSFFLGLETGETENRPASFGFRARFKRHLAFRAAFGADSGIHLAVTEPLVFALHAAVLATLRCREPTLGIKGLLTFGERKSITAVAAGDLLISHIIKKKK